MTGTDTGKPALTVVAAAGTASHGSARRPLSCPGRPTICRREGCSKAATDETIRLCPSHLGAYETDVEHSLDLTQDNDKVVLTLLETLSGPVRGGAGDAA